ncbi:MAG: methyltransferase domain-containing protein [Crocinitomicaceae bacterium]|nr:methyltransferase domain-containing protein [Crocinitomicaceae bacterium]
MATKGSFIKQFFKDKQMVGAVAPSSRFLGRKMLENINFDKAKLIIELGPGNGIFTDIILQKMAPDAKLIVFELNEDFYKALSGRVSDPRVEILHESAEFMGKYIPEGVEADCVVSSLPLMVLPEVLRVNIVNTSHKVLKPKGQYIQFQYSLQSKKLLKSIFSTVSIKFTARNIPPAFVYTCHKA